jgi:uncharacterized protein YecE (DUF72 family)
MKKKHSIHIGTSGWHYKHWRGPFYPSDMTAKDFLSHYLKFFHTVELNNSFYRLPEEKTLINWSQAVPPGFIFAAKGSRFITHMKKLRDPEESANLFLQRIQNLGDKLGPILFQLPPFLKWDLDRLSLFLEKLPGHLRFSFEFRDPSWFRDETYRALAEKGAALCIFDFSGRQAPKIITADFVYLRLHGPEGPYRGQYGSEALSGWASDFSRWAGEGKDIYCYFDNDQAGFAAQDAMNLQKMVGV